MNTSKQLLSYTLCILLAAFTVSALADVKRDANECWRNTDNGDYQAALIVCLKAAQLGDADSQFRLGNMYGFGRGVTHDKKQAAYWLTKAATQGDPAHQFKLGFMLRNGNGVAKNEQQMLYWFNKAAEQGHAIAQYNLGNMYRDGYGVQKDVVTAYAWYHLSGLLGVQQATKNKNLIHKNMTATEREKAESLSAVFLKKTASNS